MPRYIARITKKECIKKISNITEEMNSKIWKIQKTEDHSEFYNKKIKILNYKIKNYN